MKTTLSNRQRKQAVKQFPKQARQEHMITPADVKALPFSHDTKTEDAGLKIPTRILD